MRARFPLSIMAAAALLGAAALSPAAAQHPDRSAPGMSGVMGTKESGASLNPPGSPYHQQSSIFSGPVATGSGPTWHNGGCPPSAAAGRATESAGATSGGCAPGGAGTTAMPPTNTGR